MVTSDDKVQDTGYESGCCKNSEIEVKRPRPLPWCQNIGTPHIFSKPSVGEKNALELDHSSAFHRVSSEKTDTEVTWNTVHHSEINSKEMSAFNQIKYSVPISENRESWNYTNYWRPPIEVTSEGNRTEDDEEDEEIDVVNSSDDETSIRASSDTAEKLTISPTDIKSDSQSNHSTCESISRTEFDKTVRKSSISEPSMSNTPETSVRSSPTVSRDGSEQSYSASKIPRYSVLDLSSREDNLTPNTYSKINSMKINDDGNTTETARNRLMTEELQYGLPYLNTNEYLKRTAGNDCLKSDSITSERYSSPVTSPIQRHIIFSAETEHIVNQRREAYYSTTVQQSDSESVCSRSDLSSPFSRSLASIGSYPANSAESLNSTNGDILYRRQFCGTNYLSRKRGSISSYPTDSTESIFSAREDNFERRKSFGAEYLKRSLGLMGGCSADSNESVCNYSGRFLQRRQTLGTLDFRKRPLGSLSSYSTDSTESLCSVNDENLQRRSSFGSTDHIKKCQLPLYISDTSSSIKEKNAEDYCTDDKNKLHPFSTDGFSSSSRNNHCSSEELPEEIKPPNTINTINDNNDVKLKEEKFEASNLRPEGTVICKISTSFDNIEVPKFDILNVKKKPNEVSVVRELKKEIEIIQQRESVLVEAKSGKVEVLNPDKTVAPTFTPEDVTLRSRVLILLWVLLGERRLREVGYPMEPVHRILWRAVDVCCSVAGVKSAAAIPLTADHDCGSDMVCFRDHTHRFLEVCAPTREHWKQFGWASLTVDAVVRKIYEEELVPLLNMKSLPADIQKAVVHLAQLDRPSVMTSSSQMNSKEGSDKQNTVTLPVKKKRGRPAKITHKVEEGGRIERVMLWRFLLNLLEDPKNTPCIHWVQREEGIFRILNTDWLARLWGRRHGNPRMTYEKMARAMRTYYRSKVLQPVPRLRNLPRKLVYKFNPAVIRKVAAMKQSCSTFTGRGMNYNK